jgi:hypothetical protein
MSRPPVREARAPVGRMEDAVEVVKERARPRVVEKALGRVPPELLKGDGEVVDRAFRSVAWLRFC